MVSELRQWLVCFIAKSLKTQFFLSKIFNTSCQLNFTTSPTPSSLLSLLSLCFHSHTSHFILASCTSYHPPPLPTLALPMQFHPQRWRAEPYNYPSVCEMNHWAADWAAWWETSILNSSSECSQPSASSLCWCPGLACVHTQCHCWKRQGVVWNHCTP